MNNYTFSYVLITLCVHISLQSQVYINGKDINTWIRPDQTLCIGTYAADQTVISCTGINVKGDSKNIVLDFWNAYQPSELEQYIASLISLKNYGAHFQSNILNMKTDTTLQIIQEYYKGNEGICLQAEKNLFIEESLLESTHIIHVASNGTVFFNKCVVIDAPQIQIKTYLTSSIYNLFLITRDPQHQFPFALSGIIDFENNEINLVCIGAKEVRIQFTQEAFK